MRRKKSLGVELCYAGKKHAHLSMVKRPTQGEIMCLSEPAYTYTTSFLVVASFSYASMAEIDDVVSK